MRSSAGLARSRTHSEIRQDSPSSKRSSTTCDTPPARWLDSRGWPRSRRILALGLGINTAVLAVSYGVLWRPLPYPEADRLITAAVVFTRDESPEFGVRLERIDEWTGACGRPGSRS